MLLVENLYFYQTEDLKLDTSYIAILLICLQCLRFLLNIIGIWILI